MLLANILAKKINFLQVPQFLSLSSWKKVFLVQYSPPKVSSLQPLWNISLPPPLNFLLVWYRRKCWVSGFVSVVGRHFCALFIGDDEEETAAEAAAADWRQIKCFFSPIIWLIHSSFCFQTFDVQQTNTTEKKPWWRIFKELYTNYHTTVELEESGRDFFLRFW